ncbi:unnamed protein product [Didymodactylos carnosus]|nr:unnamed protein product [Didymodactylos carnosus]CAF4473291.1 unnamed protein product [Didymodactylos carnosus]
MTVLTSSVSCTQTETCFQDGKSDSQLRVKIENNWYNLTQWQHQHPGGAKILQHSNGLDVTDAFTSLHSKNAWTRLSKMHKTIAKLNDTPAPTKATLAFRRLRKQLEEDGWWKHDRKWELFYQLSVFMLTSFGTYISFAGHSIVAILLIGLGMQQAGWIGHDNTHGRGSLQAWFAAFQSGVINGFSRKWWSEKHNIHHVYTNHIGIDADIENDPLIHLFFPSIDKDVYFRRFQHYYFYII